MFLEILFLIRLKQRIIVDLSELNNTEFKLRLEALRIPALTNPILTILKPTRHSILKVLGLISLSGLLKVDSS